MQDQVIRLSRWLADAGNTVVTIAPGESDEADFVSVGRATVVRANGAATPVALSPRVAGRVVEALNGLDVVHVHEPLMPQVSLAVLRHALETACRDLPCGRVESCRTCLHPWSTCDATLDRFAGCHYRSEPDRSQGHRIH